MLPLLPLLLLPLLRYPISLTLYVLWSQQICHAAAATAAAAAAATAATAAAGTIVSQTTSCRTGTSVLAQLWQLLEYCESPRTTGTGLWTSGLRGIDKPRRAVQAG